MSSYISTLLLTVILIAPSAFAYTDGTYQCKNRKGLPDNVYKIRTISLEGELVPYVEAHRYYRRDASNPASPIDEAQLKGFGTSISLSDGTSTVMIAALQLEFKDNRLLGCDK